MNNRNNHWLVVSSVVFVSVPYLITFYGYLIQILSRSTFFDTQGVQILVSLYELSISSIYGFLLLAMPILFITFLYVIFKRKNDRLLIFLTIFLFVLYIFLNNTSPELILPGYGDYNPTDEYGKSIMFVLGLVFPFPFYLIISLLLIAVIVRAKRYKDSKPPLPYFNPFVLAGTILGVVIGRLVGNTLEEIKYITLVIGLIAGLSLSRLYTRHYLKTEPNYLWWRKSNNTTWVVVAVFAGVAVGHATNVFILDKPIYDETAVLLGIVGGLITGLVAIYFRKNI